MTIEIHFLLCVGTEEMDDIHSLLLSMHLIVLYIIDTDGLQAIRTYYYTTYVYGSVVHFCTWAKCIGESCSGTSESQQEEVSPYGSSYKLKRKKRNAAALLFFFLPFFSLLLLSLTIILTKSKMYRAREKREAETFIHCCSAFFGFRHLNF